MGVWQIVMVCLLVADFVLAAAKHGEMKSEPRYHIGYTCINIIIVAGILYMGGFFEEAA